MSNIAYIFIFLFKLLSFIYVTRFLTLIYSAILFCREVSMLFTEGEQHDAHELLITTISAFYTARQSLNDLISNEDKLDKESSSTQNMDTKPSLLPPEEHESKKQTMGTKKRKMTKHLPFVESVLENLSLGFEGKIRHVVQCLECEKRIEREESFANLEVNIPEMESNEGKPIYYLSK